MDAGVTRFFNRDLSWLEFNRRVMHQALDARTPLLERVRFTSIFYSNLDEFFMKRVGGIKRRIEAGLPNPGSEGSTPREQLISIRKAVQPMVEELSRCVTGELIPELKKNGIRLLRYKELKPSEKELAEDFFRSRVFPVLTPLAVDPGHPFPFISNLSASYGVLMRGEAGSAEELFARIKVPTVFPSWIRVNPNDKPGENRFVSLNELVGRNLSQLFPGMEIIDVMMFRVTRNADIERDDEDAEDLLEQVTEELRERRFARVVRLEHGPKPNAKILQILKEELQVADDDVYQLPQWLEYYSLSPIASLKMPELRYPAHFPVVPKTLADPEGNIFDVIRSGDILVHHPYESFTASVERFIRTAADDPKVMAIKMTLYRTGEESPFIPILIRAAESGKQVVCLVELKARFDEARNILVAQALEKAGVHVVYGLVGLKTHCKIALVVRQEPHGVVSYAHLGTGNYHAETARLYTDFGLFTQRAEITDDVVHLFHYLTGRAMKWSFKKLLVAPIDMKDSFLRMIEREAERQRTHGNGLIIAKMNALQDPDIIEALYRASQNGVSVELIVRGFCCLRPQVPGLSDNIRVFSVVGRFLEHSRLYYFRNGAEKFEEGDFYLGSADWMYRNLKQRVEAMVPVESSELRARCWETLNVLRQDLRQGWELKPDGTYVLRGEASLLDGEGTHAALIRMTDETVARQTPVAAEAP